jgi:hypothetical protein
MSTSGFGFPAPDCHLRVSHSSQRPRFDGSTVCSIGMAVLTNDLAEVTGRDLRKFEKKSRGIRHSAK